MAGTTFLVPNAAEVAYSRQKTRLDGRDYVLTFSYNEREDRWYLSLYDDEDKPILLGLKLVSNFPLLRHYHWDERVPPGELMAVDLATNLSPPPGFAELGEGRRIELTYYDQAKVQELQP